LKIRNLYLLPYITEQNPITAIKIILQFGYQMIYFLCGTFNP